MQFVQVNAYNPQTGKYVTQSYGPSTMNRVSVKKDGVWINDVCYTCEKGETRVVGRFTIHRGKQYYMTTDNGKYRFECGSELTTD